MMSRGLVDAQVFSELVQPDCLHLNPEKYQGNHGKPLLRRTNVFLAVFLKTST